MAEAQPNPYVGPRTFTYAERERFFGREREARELLARVVSERLTLFYAQSGAGKSSLINARLIPQLQAENFAVLPVGRVSGALPEGMAAVDNIFAFNLMLSLDQSQGDPGRFSRMNLSHFLTRLTSLDGERYFFDAEAEFEAKAEAKQEVYEPVPAVLIIDQFEEIITAHTEHWTQRASFFRQLDEAMTADPLLWVVLSLREDYVATLEPYSSLLADKLRARFYMQRMGYEAALEAIRRPAELGGRPFAPRAAESLVDNLRQIKLQTPLTSTDSSSLNTTANDPGRQPSAVGGHTLGQYVEPVQLQVVCYQLWENLKEHSPAPITSEDLETLGNVDTALAEFYEQTLRAAGPAVAELTLRRWFDQELITEAGTRGVVFQGAHDTAGLPNAVVKRLADHYLLRAEIRAGGTWYELVHDRFVEPILQANREWEAARLQRNPLAAPAIAWQNDPAKLLDGTQLRAAQQYAEANPQDVTGEEQDFLAESVRRAVEGEQEARQTVRRRRIVLVSTLVVMAVLAGLTWWALQQRDAAQYQAGLAATAQAKAETNEKKAAEQAQLAAQRATEAESARIEAANGRATLAAYIAVDLTATAMAIEPLAMPSPFASPADLSTPTPPTVSPVSTPNTNATARFEAVQSQLAQVSAEQTATAATPTITPTPSTAVQSALPQTQAEIPFPPPGRLVFTSNRDNADAVEHLYLMNSDGTNVRPLTLEPGSEPSYTQSTNQIFFSRRTANHVSLYAIEPEGQSETRIDDRAEDNWEAAPSPDGRTLAFVSSRDNRDWEIYVISSDRTSPARLICADQIAPDLLKWAPVWSSDSQQLAFVVSEKVPGEEQYEGQGSIWLANADGTNCHPITTTPGVIDKYPDWSPDGQQLVFASNRGDGIFRLYQMDNDGSNQRLVPNSPDHVNYPAWSPDGSWLTFSVSTRRADHRPDAIFVMTVTGEHLTNLSDGFGEDWYSIWLPGN